jgi:hypothetical protein
MPLLPLPNIPMTSMSREFLIDDVKMEITSVDIASHGGFIIVGCSNGVLLFFDITESHSQRNGTFLAHIRPKGMHTSFKLNVKITEDCRLCFAGVLKGSSEMLAIDLSAYQLSWNKNNPSALQKTNGKNKINSSSFDSSCIANFLLFSYSDAKLRGFGAATCITLPDTSRSEPVLVSSEEVKPETHENGDESLSNAVVPVASSSPGFRKYLLACGMGIKNVHVWQVIIYDILSAEEMAANPLRQKRDEWSCIYDVATNGMTITHLGFRNEGRELLTKSSSMNLRVWDLSNYHNQQPQQQKQQNGNGSGNGKKETTGLPAKPSYEDIVNTFDVKCLIENSTFTYGGTYEFATINVDKNIPKEANRNVLELPFDASLADAGSNTSSSATAAANERRRRAMREVSDVISTQDGKYALILCSDGGSIYYKHPNKNEENEENEETEPEDEELSGDRERKVNEDDERSSNEENKSPVSRNTKEHLPQLSEVVSLSKDIDNQFWSLKRVGKQGLVLLIRAFTRYEKERKNEVLPAGTIPPMSNGTPVKNGVSVISLVTLYDLLNTKEGRTTFLATAESSKGKKGTVALPWHRSGMFYQEDPSFFLNNSPSMSTVVSVDEGDNDDRDHDQTPSVQVDRCLTPLPFLSKNIIDNDDDVNGEGKSNGIALETPKTGFERVASSGSLVKLPKTASKLPPTTGKKRKFGGKPLFMLFLFLLFFC